MINADEEDVKLEERHVADLLKRVSLMEQTDLAAYTRCASRSLLGFLDTVNAAPLS